MTENPYQAPLSEVVTSTDHPNPWNGIFARTWRRSKGIRLKGIGISALFWIPLLGISVALIPLMEDSPFTFIPLMVFIVYVVGPLGGRLAAMSMTKLYVGHVRGESVDLPVRETLFSGFALIGAVLVGGLVVSFSLLLFRESSDTIISLTRFIVPVPLLMMLPFLWMASGHWCEGAGFVEGLRRGKNLLLQHAGSAVVTVTIVMFWGVFSAVVLPLFLLFDPMSKMIFAEAYVSAETKR